jgi:16S rRNA processing protein RimM
MSLSSYQPIAKISSFCGLNGEVKLTPLSRYFEDYINYKYFMLGRSRSDLEEVILDMITGSGKKRVFKFSGFDSLTDAESIKGKTLYKKVSKDEKINLISKDLLGWDIINDLVGKVGTLINVMWLPNNDVYIIKNGDKEYLIPVIKEIIKKVDYDKREIIINSIDGLID